MTLLLCWLWGLGWRKSLVKLYNRVEHVAHRDISLGPFFKRRYCLCQSLFAGHGMIPCDGWLRPSNRKRRTGLREEPPARVGAWLPCRGKRRTGGGVDRRPCELDYERAWLSRKGH